MHNLAKWLIGIGVATIVGLAIWFQTRPVPGPEPAVEASVAPATQPAAEAPEPIPEPGPKADTEPVLVPEFDVVRVTPDGQAVLAGRAAAGQTLEILQDGKVIGTVVVDPTGEFAAVLDIKLAGEAILLTARTPLGTTPEVSVAVEAAGAEQAVAAEAATANSAAKNAAAEVADSEAKAAAAEAAEADAAVAAAKAAAAQTATAEPSAGTASGEAASQSATAKIAAAEAVAAAKTAVAKAAAAEAAAANAAAAEAAAAAETAVAEAAKARRAADATSAEPEGMRFAVSTPVIILPPEGADQAPLLVKTETAGVTLMQPAATEAAGIVLDRITYSEQGDLVAAGRGRPGSLIRIYANAIFLQEIRCDDAGQWQVQIASEVASSTLLLRFDEVDADGHVVSRIETPFEYSPLVTAHELRDRKIVVQKGDYLWKFAEQHYGAGWRYSVIYSANAELIRDPDLIYPGQVFSVPELVDSQ